MEWARAGWWITSFLNFFVISSGWEIWFVGGFVLVLGKLQDITQAQKVFFCFTAIKDEWSQRMVTGKSQQPLFRNLLSSAVAY